MFHGSSAFPSVCLTGVFVAEQAERVYRKFRLLLVTTSVACERVRAPRVTTAAEAMAEGDGMAMSLLDIQELHRRMYGDEEEVGIPAHLKTRLYASGRD